MASLITRNDLLHSLYELLPDDPQFPLGEKVRIGAPLIVRYLRFRLQHEKGRQQIMISTFVKTEEQKAAAAEAVNYYNARARFDAAGSFTLSDFGGECYGHPLCYYTKSYLGETIRLTTKVMEIDRLDRRTMEVLRDGLGRAAMLPMFTEYLGYMSLLDAGFRVAEKLVNFLNRDDTIIESHSLDLHFGRTNARRLQDGRVICIPGAEPAEFTESESWHLGADNRLVETATGREYDRGSYFVLEVKAEDHPAYERFEHYQGVAELLALTNRGTDPRDLIDLGLEMARGYQDQRLLAQMEELPADDERRAAMAKLLSPAIRKMVGGG